MIDFSNIKTAVENASINSLNLSNESLMYILKYEKTLFQESVSELEKRNLTDNELLEFIKIKYDRRIDFSKEIEQIEKRNLSQDQWFMLLSFSDKKIFLKKFLEKKPSFDDIMGYSFISKVPKDSIEIQRYIFENFKENPEALVYLIDKKLDQFYIWAWLKLVNHSNDHLVNVLKSNTKDYIKRSTWKLLSEKKENQEQMIELLKFYQVNGPNCFFESTKKLLEKKYANF